RRPLRIGRMRTAPALPTTAWITLLANDKGRPCSQRSKRVASWSIHLIRRTRKSSGPRPYPRTNAAVAEQIRTLGTGGNQPVSREVTAAQNPLLGQGQI